MRRFRFPVVVALLLAMTITVMAPAAPVSAASLTDILPKTTSDSSSSGGSGLMNILLGLLFGKLFGNVSDSGSTLSKVLGANTTPTSTTPSSTTSTGTTSTSAKASAIINTAKQYMGVPYVFGGDDPSTGLDCSSFTQLVMKQNGITLPRTAADQFATGTPVDKANLQVGDLVFFTTYKPGASHVGIYMGNDKFIHDSSAAKQVTISNLSEDYYTSHYIGARRYF